MSLPVRVVFYDDTRQPIGEVEQYRAGMWLWTCRQCPDPATSAPFTEPTVGHAMDRLDSHIWQQHREDT